MAEEKKKRYRSTFYYEGRRYEATGKNQKEADKKAALKQDKLKRGEAGYSGNMTVERWAREWLETYKKPTIGIGQYKNYKLHIDGVIVPAIGSQKLKSIKDLQLQQILNSRAGRSKSDLSKLRMTLNAIFKRACISRLIDYNPAENLELPAAKTGTHRSITPDERYYILELAPRHHGGLWVLTMLYCGLRPGETRALDWKHVDFEKRMVHIEVAMKAASTTIGTPKTESGIRDVPIPDALYDALWQARGELDEPVFKQPTTGKRHTVESMRCLWNNFKRELNISMGAKVYRNKIKVSVVADDLVPYCLRHTYCTDLQDAGVPINIAKYLMGHSDIAVTARIYTHTTERAIRIAADKINSI